MAMTRQLVHLEPPQGFLNDPNGLCFFRGIAYVFHQWNRFACDRSYKEWGCFCSCDLIHWEHRGTGILPDTPYDKNGCYSGSAVVEDDVMHLFYTGNVRNEDGGRTPYQCHAASTDGRTFVKELHPMPPPSGYSEHFRDPFVWKGHDAWWMMVGAQDIENRGCIALYSSDDGTNWTYRGKHAGDAYAAMCECPSLGRVGERGVLLTCPQERSVGASGERVTRRWSQYELGNFDEIEGSFAASDKPRMLDRGFDFYAPQLVNAPDGRCLLWAWMSGMTPEEEIKCPTRGEGFLHCLTFPRELSLCDGELVQRPIREIDAMVTRCSEHRGDAGTLSAAGACLFRFRCGPDARSVQIELGSGGFSLHWDRERASVTLTRPGFSSWGKTSIVDDLEALQSLELLWDMTSVEAFINGGRRVYSSRLFGVSDRFVIYYGLGSSGMAARLELEANG